MNPWFGNAIVLLGIIGTLIVRAPYGKGSRETKVVEDKKSPLEIVLLSLMSISMMILPILSMITPVFAFANYTISLSSFLAGSIVMVVYLWLFYRSHADLGKNWSVSLEIREKHRVITSGVYRNVRHPMYTAFFLYGIAQTLLLPNWIAGPSCLAAFAIMFMLRVNVEERMMLETFGTEYQDYMNRTKRLIPRLY
jgi:protein-S-isoprenylcysteine O-methyltransferase Ste14